MKHKPNTTEAERLLRSYAAYKQQFYAETYAKTYFAGGRRISKARSGRSSGDNGAYREPCGELRSVESGDASEPPLHKRSIDQSVRRVYGNVKELGLPSLNPCPRCRQ